MYCIILFSHSVANIKYFTLASDSTDGLARRQSADFVLGVIPRHCILHALTVIKEALYKVSCVYCILDSDSVRKFKFIGG